MKRSHPLPCTFLMITLLTSCIGGCSSQSQDTEKEVVSTTETEQEEGIGSLGGTCVYLDEIEKPEIGRVFFTLHNKEWYDVVYATGDDFVLDYRSGFPGFGYSIIVKGSAFCQTEYVDVQTKYGDFTYVFDSSFTYEIKDVNKTFLDSKLFHLGREEERLYLCNYYESRVFVYRLAEGTVILDR